MEGGHYPLGDIIHSRECRPTWTLFTSEYCLGGQFQEGTIFTMTSEVGVAAIGLLAHLHANVSSNYVISARNYRGGEDLALAAIFGGK